MGERIDKKVAIETTEVRVAPTSHFTTRACNTSLSLLCFDLPFWRCVLQSESEAAAAAEAEAAYQAELELALPKKKRAGIDRAKIKEMFTRYTGWMDVSD